jgi:hypothetical protein
MNLNMYMFLDSNGQGNLNYQRLYLRSGHQDELSLTIIVPCYHTHHSLFNVLSQDTFFLEVPNIILVFAFAETSTARPYL